MSNAKNTAEVEATRSLVLWTGLNWSGNGLQVSNAQAGILAADVGIWDYKSVGVSAMQLFVWSAPDTATPGYSFNGHIESLLSENQGNLPLLYAGAEFPLQYIGINPADVGVLFVSVDSGDTPISLAFSQTYPNSTVPLTTFAAPGTNGALGFFSLLSGSSNHVAVQYGDYSLTDGSVTWTGNGNLTIEWNGSTPTVSASSGLPDRWRFGAPTKQTNGSWLLTLSATGSVANTGTLFTGKGFTGSSKILLPHALTQLNSGIGWTYNSLKLSDMPALIYSSFAPSNTNYVFSGYQEQLLTTNIDDFSATFAGTPPVNLLSLDNTDVIVRAAVITQKENDSAWIITQSYPQAFYTFASTNAFGVLAILPASGSTQTISMSYGSLNTSGLFTATGTTTLSANMDNGVPVLTPGSDWPTTLILSAPTQETDGSWTVAIADSRVVISPVLYPLADYNGTPITLAEHQSVELRTLADLWQYDSVRVFGLRWLSSTLFDPQSSLYDYRKYRDSYSDADVPDISKDYPLASAVINGIVLGANDVVVEVQLKPTDTTKNAVLSASQSWPQAFYTAATRFDGLAQPGVLIVFDKTQALHTVPIKLGTLNADGTANWQATTTVTARWDSTLAKPVLVLGQDAPADFQLSPVQSTSLAGEFTTILSLHNGSTITLYAITGAPSSTLPEDESFTTNNKVALYSSQPASLSLHLSGNAKFRRNNQATLALELPALTMTTLEFYSPEVEEVTVTVTGDSIDTLSATVNFTSIHFEGDFGLAANSGAPANGGVTNSVYLDTTTLSYDTVHITLSGSAVFADTGGNDKVFDINNLGHDLTFDVTDKVAETVTITAEFSNYKTTSITMTFVKTITPDSDPVTYKSYPISGAPSTGSLEGDESYTTNDQLVLYSNKPISVLLEVVGTDAKFRDNDEKALHVNLPALQMTPFDIYNSYDSVATTGVSGKEIQSIIQVIDFSSFPFNGNHRLAATTGAPANKGIENTVYLDTKNITPQDVHITLTGSAIFAGTNLNDKIFPLSAPAYDLTVGVINTVAETVTITAEFSDFSKISTTTTFVST